jgi:hypothetical protein
VLVLKHRLLDMGYSTTNSRDLADATGLTIGTARNVLIGNTLSGPTQGRLLEIFLRPGETIDVLLERISPRRHLHRGR